MKQYLWLIILTIWLTFLTWRTNPRSVYYWQGMYAEMVDSMNAGKDREIEYLRRINQLEKQIRLVGTSPYPYVEVAPRDTLDLTILPYDIIPKTNMRIWRFEDSLEDSTFAQMEEDSMGGN